MAKRQPEGLIKDDCREIAREQGLIFWNVEGKSINGVPDTLCGKVSGGTVLVEFKRPGKTPTDQQWLRIYELRQAGQDAWWADSVDKWMQLVGLKPRVFQFEYPAKVLEWL